MGVFGSLAVEVRRRRGGVDGDELDEIKEEHSDRQDKDEKVGEL